MTFNKVLVMGIDQSKLDQETWDAIDELAENRVMVSKDSPKILKEFETTDCLLVNQGLIVSKEMIEQAKNLKYIGVLATGYGRIDYEFAAKKGVTLIILATEIFENYLKQEEEKK